MPEQFKDKLDQLIEEALAAGDDADDMMAAIDDAWLTLYRRDHKEGA